MQKRESGLLETGARQTPRDLGDVSLANGIGERNSKTTASAAKVTKTAWQ
jgi:hypothetical protein